MSKADSAVQLGMFGVPNALECTHVVAAHTRLLASGDTAFVPEHVRWNRGQTARTAPATPRAAASDPLDEGQPSLFAARGAQG